jgi:hypothetical protein
LGFLKSLHQTGTDFFVEGGQAVNFWAEYVDSMDPSRPMDALRPFTSKDCDVWVSQSAWEQLKQNPGGSLRKSQSPADGQLAILTLDQQPPLVVDLMTTVYGIRAMDYPRLLERVLDDGTVKVLDPIYLFLSKCHCLLGLDQSGRQDERHVRMLALILPSYLSLLIDSAEAEKLTDRAILREIKLLLKILSTSACRRAIARLEIDPDSLIPWKPMETCGLPAVEDFVQARWKHRRPQK